MLSEGSVILDGNIIINLRGDAIRINDATRVVVSDCYIYGGIPSFWRGPLLWLSLKILFWKHRNMRGETGSAINIQSLSETTNEGVTE